MIDTVEIALEPVEILDRVDDMLSWLAVASQCASLYYNATHFYRANPIVLLGDGAYGRIVPSGLVAREHAEPSADDVLSPSGEWLPSLLRVLGNVRDLRHASLIECNPSDRTPYSGQGSVTRGDDTADCSNGLFISGVSHRLDSVGELAPKESRRYALGCRFPQSARIFVQQHLLVLRDGRAQCTNTLFGMWNGCFYDRHKRQLGLRLEGRDGLYSPELFALRLAASHLIENKSAWTVELSLGSKRTGVGLRTDALGAREFVNMLRGSDTVDGRRKSIVHWVSEHMRRRNRLDAAATVKVASHLRGIQGLDAGRYHARIWPSRDDVEAAKNGARFAVPA